MPKKCQQTTPLVKGQGHVIRLPEFQKRAELGVWAWRKLKKRAEAAGHRISYRLGRNVLVDVDKVFRYLDSNDGGAA